MIDPIQPITVHQAYDGITHARQWASWNLWWRMVDDDDGDESPSPEPRTDSRSALPRGFRAWRRLHIVKRNDFFSLIFFSPKANILWKSWNSTEYLRKNNNKTSLNMKTRGPTPFPQGWGCASYLVGPLETSRLQLQLYISAFGEKKIREKKSSCFTIRSHRQAMFFLGRADLDSVLGSGEGNPSPSSS